MDKGLVRIAGRPMVEWILEALAPQVGTLLISANRNLTDYAVYGRPVVSDEQAGFQGPLAGILSALRHVSTDWVLTVPCDGPLLPDDLAGRLIAAVVRTGATLAVASDGTAIQPVYALLPVKLAQSLEDNLAEGRRRMGDWIGLHQPAIAEFTDTPMAFANANTPADIAALEALLLEGRRAGRSHGWTLSREV
jgi:molybdopterin-guanine dinucleotide biosynthesis protein A